ncbi:MAG: hypothetical protein ACXABU_17255, partial [Candidatus Hodarchaeales archaeon]
MATITVITTPTKVIDTLSIFSEAIVTSMTKKIPVRTSPVRTSTGGTHFLLIIGRSDCNYQSP